MYTSFVVSNILVNCTEIVTVLCQTEAYYVASVQQGCTILSKLDYCSFGVPYHIPSRQYKHAVSALAVSMPVWLCKDNKDVSTEPSEKSLQ